MKELGNGTTYNTHNTTSLIRTLKYVSDILHTEEAFTVKGYKHTHTHTHVSRKGCDSNESSARNIESRLGNTKTGFLMVLHPLNNSEIQNYYQNEQRFNGVYSINCLPNSKDGAYAINLDEYKSAGTHWIALYENANNAIYFLIVFDSFRTHSRRN